MDLEVSTHAAFAQDYQRVRAENATLSGESRNRRVVSIGTIVEVLNSTNGVTAQRTVACL